MAFERHPWGVTRTLVLTIKPGTGYSFIAANPCCEADASGLVSIIFEGCADATCQWRLFHAQWMIGDAAAYVDPEPMMAGANPSTYIEDGVRYLTFSRLTDDGYRVGFETCVMEQPC